MYICTGKCVCVYIDVHMYICVCMYLTYFTYYGLFIYFLWNECHYASDIVIRSLLCVCTHVFLHRRNNGPILNNSFFWSCGSCYFHDFYGSEIQKELSWMNFIVVCHWILVRCWLELHSSEGLIERWGCFQLVSITVLELI